MNKFEKKLESIKLEEGREYLDIDFDFGEETVLNVIGRVEQITEYCMNNKSKKKEEYEEKVFNGIVIFIHKCKDIIEEGIKAQ